MPNEAVKEVAKNVAENALNESLSGFVDNLNTAMTVVSNKLISSAPDAVHLLLKAIQLKACIDIATAAIAIAVGSLALIKLSPKFLKMAQEAAPCEAVEVVGAVSFLASTVIGLFFVLCGLVEILSTSNLIAIFSPEAAIALKALGAAGIK
jgi:hypothetical protein